MGSVLQPAPFQTFERGIFRELDATRTPRGAVYDGRNVMFQNGIVRKRFGFDNLGPALSGTIQRVFDFFNVAGTQNTLAIGTAGIWSYADATSTWTQRTTYASGSLTQIPSITVFNGTVIVANGGDPMKSWDGIAGSFSNLTGTPPTTARYVLGYQNHLLCAQPTIAGTFYPYRVMWSDFNNPNQWASGDAAIVDLLDTSDPINGLALIGNYGVVGRRGSLWLIAPASSPAFYQFWKQVDGYGVLAPGSFTEQSVTPKGIPFLSDVDLCVFNGSVATPVALSQERPGESPLRNVLAAGAVNYAQIGTAVCDIDIDHGFYLLAFPSTGTSLSPDLIAAWDWPHDTMTLHDKPVTALGRRARPIGVRWMDVTVPWNAVGPLRWNDPLLNAQYPLVCCAQGAQVFQQSPFLSDNGAAITSTITTRLWDLDWSGMKRVERAQITFNVQQKGLLTYYHLTSDSSDLSQATQWGPYFADMTQNTQVWLDIDDTPPAKYHAAKIVHNIVNADLALKDLTFWHKRRGVQG